MNFKHLRPTNQEPEYQVDSPLKISSVGTDNTRVIPNEPPIGSAVWSRSGARLSSWGIKHIIHAAPQAFSGSNEEQFRKQVVLSGQNSVILAKRVESRKLAICFVGSAIYGGNSNREELANAFVKGVVNQAEQEKMEVLFVAHNSEGRTYQGKNLNVWFKEAVEKNPSGRNKGIVSYDEFSDLQTHNVDAIVNAANRQCSLFGGGITGALGKAAGSEAGQISAETKALIKELNDVISDKNNNNEIITCRVKYKGPTVSIIDGTIPCFSFKPLDANRNEVVFSQKSPFFTDNPPKFNVEYELSYREKVGVGGIFKTVELIKIKEIRDNDKVECDECRKDLGKDFACGNSFNESKDLKLCSKCYSDLTILHSKFKGYEISRNGNSTIIVYDGKTEKKDKEFVANFQEELGKVDSSLEQVFADENKVKEWKKQGKLGNAKALRNLLETVKNSSNFLNLIKIKQNINNLKEFVSDKTPSEVIKVIKRFEYDNLSKLEKEIKVKRMRKYYNLGENDALTDSRINEYCYKVAVGQINENEQDPNNTINPENNILKYFGIGALILMPLGLLLAFFIRKRKK